MPPLPAFLSPPSVLPAPARRRHSCCPIRLCETSKQPIDTSARVVNSKRAASLFNGPEAVLGVLLAGGALFLDFTRHISRLFAREPPANSEAGLQSGLATAQDAVTAQSVALTDAKKDLATAESDLDEALERAAIAENAVQLQSVLAQAATQRDRTELANSRLRDLLQSVENAAKDALAAQEQKVAELQQLATQTNAEAEHMQNRLHAARKKQKELDELQDEVAKARKKRGDTRKQADLAASRLAAARKTLLEEERETEMLESVLKERKFTVQEISRETERLRASLQASEMELRDLVDRSVSFVGEHLKGGDSNMSQDVLKGIKEEVLAAAEELGASLQLARVEEQAEKDVLEKVEIEMDAEGKRLEAGIRKAKAVLKVGEGKRKRRQQAIENVIKEAAQEEK